MLTSLLPARLSSNRQALLGLCTAGGCLIDYGCRVTRTGSSVWRGHLTQLVWPLGTKMELYGCGTLQQGSRWGSAEVRACVGIVSVREDGQSDCLKISGPGAGRHCNHVNASMEYYVDAACSFAFHHGKHHAAGCTRLLAEHPHAACSLHAGSQHQLTSHPNSLLAPAA